MIGAGTMGGGISMNFLSAGIPVTIVEMAQDALDRGTGVMRKNYEATAAKGRMTGEQVEQAMGALKPTLDFDALADCDLIIEAVFEKMEVKKEIFGRLDKIAKPGAILASNTSYLNVDEIAASTSRPQDVVGLHFFSPANVMKLLEVVRGAKTAPDVLVTAMAARQEDQEGRGRRRRLPRLHRQPHADAAPGRGDQAAARRRDARTDRPRPCRIRHADGAVPDGRPRRGRHRLAPRPDPDREYPRRARRRGPLGPEEGRRLLRL